MGSKFFWQQYEQTWCSITYRQYQCFPSSSLTRLRQSNVCCNISQEKLMAIVRVWNVQRITASITMFTGSEIQQLMSYYTQKIPAYILICWFTDRQRSLDRSLDRKITGFKDWSLDQYRAVLIEFWPLDEFLDLEKDISFYEDEMILRH